ncbi:MAG TPA: CHAP domain-containing protein [Archangium sp.]|nr:CHAP domain-containing protein [Archangium sp.]
MSRNGVIRSALMAVLLVVGSGCAGVEDTQEELPVQEEPGTEQQEACSSACGAVMASIDGHAAYSNAGSQGTGYSCVGGCEFGLCFQCVELAQRYFYKRWGVGPKMWPVDYAAQMCDRAPAGSTVYRQGSGYKPVHGDLMVFNWNTWGHVAVVDSVSGAYANVVEQNASCSGRNQYALTQASCFIHANNNTSARVGYWASGAYEASIVDCYNRNGGQAAAGLPFDSGGTAYVHTWGAGVTQDMTGGYLGPNMCMRRNGYSTAYMVRGGIRDAYMVNGGGEGWLGFPTSDEFSANGAPRQNYVGGYITWNGSAFQAYRY